MNRVWHILLFAIIMAVNNYAVAHDLGIQKVFLDEQKDGTFILKAEGPDYIIQGFSPPFIPGKCQFIEQSEGAFSGGIVRYVFNCESSSLTAEDKIILIWDIEGVIVFASWADGTKANHLFQRGASGIVVELSMLQVGSGSFTQASTRYISLGIEHILLGIDHLLFVLGLLLLVKNGWMLVKTITSFTVAHSITLAFASLGFVTAPAQLIDALVALSIVFVAVEIIYSNQDCGGLSVRYPWVVAFGFGLLHGFGFAGALNALGLPTSEIPLALFTFNIGVEIGQLMFVGVFLLLIWAFNQLQIKNNRFTKALPPYAIGVLATFWLIQRIIIIFI